MREIDVRQVTETIAKLCMDSCCYLPCGVQEKIRKAATTEESPLGKEILNTLIDYLNNRLKLHIFLSFC